MILIKKKLPFSITKEDFCFNHQCKKFLGIGLPLEVISWGSMLSLSEKALMTKAWWIILIPGVFLIVTLLSFTSIGNYLRKQANRKQRNL